MVTSLAYYVTLLRKDFTDYCNQQLSDMGLSQGMLFFILYVGKHPSCSPKDLAQALQMDAGHTARSLARLEQGGFLLQEVNANDRRARVLKLTEKGESAFQLSHEMFIQWDNRIMTSFPEEERTLLMTLLQKLSSVRCIDDKEEK